MIQLFARRKPWDRRHVEITVEDNGAGIPESMIERIFDPFFTTKGPDQGSGLGLWICHRIVTEHGGTISVTSKVGEGTSFIIELPVPSAATEQSTQPDGCPE